MNNSGDVGMTWFERLDAEVECEKCGMLFEFEEELKDHKCRQSETIHK